MEQECSEPIWTVGGGSTGRLLQTTLACNTTSHGFHPVCFMVCAATQGTGESTLAAAYELLP